MKVSFVFLAFFVFSLIAVYGSHKAYAADTVDHFNSVDIVLDPASGFSLNTKFKISVKVNNIDPSVSTIRSAYLYLCDTAATPTDCNYYSNEYDVMELHGVAGQTEFKDNEVILSTTQANRIIDATKTKDYTLLAYVSYIGHADSLSDVPRHDYYGYKTISIGPVVKGADAKLEIANSNLTVAGSTALTQYPAKELSFVYTAGASSPAIKNFAAFCMTPEQFKVAANSGAYTTFVTFAASDLKDTASIIKSMYNAKAAYVLSTSDTKFSCTYPREAASYNAQVSALSVTAVDPKENYLFYSWNDKDAKAAGTIVSTGYPVAVSTTDIAAANGGDPSTSNIPSGQCGSSLGCYISQFFSWIITGIVTIIYWLFAYIVSPLIEAILQIKTYKDNFAQVIYPGWLILRNVSNIAFILIMLIIGLATIFQVEGYNYRSLLVKVIISAIAVNFSLVIGQSVLGIAETAQNQFLSDKSPVVRALGYELMVKPVEQLQKQAKPSSSTGAAFADLTQPFFLLFLAVSAFITFLAILAFLIVRIVALWILLMVSPLAYVARVLPSTQKYFGMWWSQFLGNAFVVVILGFFLNIAAIFANSHVFGQGSDVFIPPTGGNISDFVYLTASHFTLIVFLLAGLKVAASSGAWGAKKIVSMAEKGINQGFKIAATGGLTGNPVGRAVTGAVDDRFVKGSVIDPRNWQKSYKDYKEKQLDSRVKARRAAQGNWAPENIIKNYDPLNGKNWSRALRNASYFQGARRNGKLLVESEENSKVLTDRERAERQIRLKNTGDDLTNAASNIVGKIDARAFSNNLTGSIERLEKERRDAASQRTDFMSKGFTAEADNANAKAIALQSEIDDLSAVKNELDNQINYNGLSTVDMNSVKASLLARKTTPIEVANAESYFEKNIFDQAQYKKKLSDEISDVNDEVAKDDKLRIKIGLKAYSDPSHVVVTPAMISKFKADAKTYQEKVDKAQLPKDYFARTLALQKESEAIKPFSDVDDPNEMAEIARQAAATKNGALFAAMAKKMAKGGDYGSLMEQFGKKGDSAQDFRDFVTDILPNKIGLKGPAVMQLATSIDRANKDNGNYNASHFVKVKDGVTSLRDEDERQKEVTKTLAGKNVSTVMNNAKVSTFIETHMVAGKEVSQLSPAARKFFESITAEQADRYMRNMPAKVARAITDSDDWKRQLSRANVAVTSKIEQAAKLYQQP